MIGTPYVTPDQLLKAPLGISWGTIPSKGATPEDQLAEQTNICWRASDMIDSYCNQPLRATVDTETIYGPDWAMTIDGNGVVHVNLSRWPVLKVTAAQYSPATSFPRSWTTLDPTQTMDLDESLAPDFGSSVAGAAGVGPRGIYLAPGYIDFASGRRGWLLSLTYVNGWPHTSLTANATAGATTLAVDDCTGWNLGSTLARVYDGANTETVTVTAASATTGPGSLTLASGLAEAHSSGVMVSTLPQNVIWAAMLFCAAQAMERGATAISVQGMPGALVPGEGSEEKFMVAGEMLLSPYKRTGW